MKNIFTILFFFLFCVSLNSQDGCDKDIGGSIIKSINYNQSKSAGSAAELVNHRSGTSRATNSAKTSNRKRNHDSGHDTDGITNGIVELDYIPSLDYSSTQEELEAAKKRLKEEIQKNERNEVLISKLKSEVDRLGKMLEMSDEGRREWKDYALVLEDTVSNLKSQNRNLVRDLSTANKKK